MNALTDIAAAEKTGTDQGAVNFHYTICPVLAASNIAVLHGLFDEEIGRAGGHPIYLRSLADNAGWLPHFTHQYSDLFRDGGAIPPVHAKASGVDTILIGLTWVRNGIGGQVLVRADGGIRRVADLKGRRVGLYRSLNSAKVDFRRATAHRQLLLALELSGLSADQVQWVDIDDPETPKYRQARDPQDYFAQGRALEAARDDERAALADGKVDAIYASGARAKALAATGAFTPIEDLSRHPDWRLHISNSPFATTVNRDFAERHPGIVVAWLRSAIRAGRWTNKNPAAAAELFTRITSAGDTTTIQKQIEGTDLSPSLTPANLAALVEQKRFLLEHGYIERDFEIADWVEPRFLDEALASL